MPKDSKTKRIFIVGESVARFFGESEKLMAEKLGGCLPGYKFEVINCGTSGYDAYRISLIVEELVNYSPDLVILLAGNNDFFQKKEDGALLRTKPARFLLKHSKAFRYISLKVQRAGLAHIRRPYRDEYFPKYVKAMLQTCRQKDLPVVVCTIPVNIRDFPPDRPDIHPLYNKEYFLALKAFGEGRYGPAAKDLGGLMQDPHFSDNPYVYYYAARTAEEQKNYELAAEYYAKAVSYDSFPGIRCSPERNAMIRKLADEQGAILADVETMFAGIAPHHLPGRELFKDHCHWWVSLNGPIQDLIIDALYEHDKNGEKAVLGPIEHWKYPGLPVIDMLGLNRSIAAEKDDQLRSNMLWGASHIIQYHGSMTEAAICYFKDVIVGKPSLMADMVTKKENIRAAVKNNMWTSAITDDVDKFWYDILWHAGEAYRQTGAYQQAFDCFTRSLQLNKNQVYPCIFRGLVYSRLNDPAGARRDWAEAARRDKRFDWLNSF